MSAPQSVADEDDASSSCAFRLLSCGKFSWVGFPLHMGNECGPHPPSSRPSGPHTTRRDDDVSARAIRADAATISDQLFDQWVEQELRRGHCRVRAGIAMLALLAVAGIPLFLFVK